MWPTLVSPDPLLLKEFLEVAVLAFSNYLDSVKGHFLSNVLKGDFSSSNLKASTSLDLFIDIDLS
jgi:hypothetical protein